MKLLAKFLSKTTPLIILMIVVLQQRTKGHEVGECPYVTETMHAAVVKIIGNECTSDPPTITGKGGALLSLEGARFWLETEKPENFKSSEHRKFLIEQTEKTFVWVMEDTSSKATSSKVKLDTLFLNVAKWMRAEVGETRGLVLAHLELARFFLDSMTVRFDAVSFPAVEKSIGAKYELEGIIHGAYHKLKGGCDCCGPTESTLGCMLRKIAE